MQPAKYYDIGICIKNEVFKDNQCFIGKFKVFFFDGYLALYGQKIDMNIDLDKYIKNISKLKNNSSRVISKSSFTLIIYR